MNNNYTIDVRGPERARLSNCSVATAVLVTAVAWLVGSSGSAIAQVPECDRACLTDIAEQYIEAMVEFDGMALPGEVAPLPWADRVLHTENDVGLQIGDGVWGTAIGNDEGFILPDPETGNVLWFGIVEEHGDRSYLGIRLGIEGQAIAEVESVVGREGIPSPYVPPDDYELDRVFSRTVPAGERLPRARLEALVTGYYSSLQLNDGTVQTELADDCRRLTNGVATTHDGDIDVTGCRQQIEIGLHRHVDRVRALRLPIVDVSRGVVVALAFLDHAARDVEYQTLDGKTRRIPVEYPNSHSVLEIFKIEDGAITRIEGVSAFQPYLMPTHWVP